MSIKTEPPAAQSDESCSRPSTIRVPARLRRAGIIHACLVVAITPAAVLATIWSCHVYGLNLTDLIFWMAAHFVGFAGVAIGLHRYFSHRAFTCGRKVEAVLAFLGMASAQGSLMFWVANHRHHHRTSDTSEDPHTPVGRGGGLAGLWRAHFGWMFGHRYANPVIFARDLLADRKIVRLNRLYPYCVAGGLVLPALAGWAVLGGGEGAIRGFIWGGLLRMATVQNTTFAVNSLCHSLGRRAYKTRDNSRNIGWLAIPSLGDSWHNNHHAHPYSARMGMAAGELDPGFRLILVLKSLGLVCNVRGLKPDPDPDNRGARSSFPVEPDRSRVSTDLSQNETLR